MNEMTEEMMLSIAQLLPEHYWGFYRARMLAGAPKAKQVGAPPEA